MIVELYREKSYDAKRNAQLNLIDRTHYVDDDTLRYHKSRVISARHHDNGLLFSIVTSDALDMHNTKRGFRFVIFDLFGHVLMRPDLENTFRTSPAARKALYAELNKIDARAVTHAAIERETQHFDCEMERLKTTLRTLSEKETA